MIEFVSEERCITCNKCVQVCPMNVFSAVKNAPPVIARQEDCQTCFICELYCPVDALYVAPDTDRVSQVSEQCVIADGLLRQLPSERVGDCGWRGSSDGPIVPIGRRRLTRCLLCSRKRTSR
jgi:NAD-dependent dihydropyrimidine dehydrogenase PreA subunit